VRRRKLENVVEGYEKKIKNDDLKYVESCELVIVRRVRDDVDFIGFVSR
jgi:hypothetical protein